MRKLWDAFEVAMNDAALAEDLLRDGRARNAFHLELERTLRMFGLLTPAPAQRDGPLRELAPRAARGGGESRSSSKVARAKSALVS